MKAPRHLFPGSPLAGHRRRAQDDADDDVPARRGESVEKDLFYPRPLLLADGVIDSGSSWGHSGPWVEDVDGDGLKDLVAGDFSGLFRFYRNAGTNPQPLREGCQSPGRSKCRRPGPRSTDARVRVHSLWISDGDGNSTSSQPVRSGELYLFPAAWGRESLRIARSSAKWGRQADPKGPRPEGQS